MNQQNTNKRASSFANNNLPTPSYKIKKNSNMSFADYLSPREKYLSPLPKTP